MTRRRDGMVALDDRYSQESQEEMLRWKADPEFQIAVTSALQSTFSTTREKNFHSVPPISQPGCYSVCTQRLLSSFSLACNFVIRIGSVQIFTFASICGHRL